MIDIRLPFIGLVVGFLVGISGVGGSSLMTPLLILLLRVNPLIAVGTDLAYSVPTKLLGGYVHSRQGTIDRRLLVTLLLGGVPAAVVGVGVLLILRSSLGLATLNAALRHMIGLLLLIAAAAIMLTPVLSRLRKKPPESSWQWTRATHWRIIALGALVGFVVSLTSIGSGVITMPILYMLVPRLGLRRLVGSDVAFSAALNLLAALGHGSLGNVNLTLTLSLLVGSLPGVYIGSKLCAGLPDTWFRPIVAGTMVWAGASLI